MAAYDLEIPISEDEIRALCVGDTVRLSGVLTTGRDAAHKYMIDNFVRSEPSGAELSLYTELRQLLAGGAIYHCGPVVRKRKDGRWEFVAAGPTTSIREEPYQADIIAHFGLRGVIGKGGMGAQTLRACQEFGAVYLHAVGGAASLIADAVKEVVDVHKMAEFGVPEAFWVIRVEDFPLVVTMDTHGRSIHKQVGDLSEATFKRLVSA